MRAPPNLPVFLSPARQGVPYPLRSKGWDKITADAEMFASFSQYRPKIFHAGLKPGVSQSLQLLSSAAFSAQHVVVIIS
jgi:hypothetical protein